MSLDIWTRCAGPSEVRPLACEAWRVVESQYVTSTRKLVDSDDEQILLEHLLERAKPPLVPDLAGLHYLLATPFRYAPLPYGSRFGTRRERGIFYAALALRTSFAEVAYYRLLFLEGTRADLEPLLVDLSAFAVSIATDRGVNLTAPPFDAWSEPIGSRTRYADSQPLGAAMRSAGVEVFLYRSARDVRGGVGVGMFTPAFTRPRPKRAPDAWVCVASRSQVEMRKRDVFRERRFRFPRSDFEVAGALPGAG